MIRLGDPKNRVCALTVPYPGVVQWLSHGAELGLWQLVVFEESDGGGEIRVPEADVYLLGAWHEAYRQLWGHIRARFPGARIVVAWSSSVGEMDHAQVEIMYALQIRSALKRGDPLARLDGVACLDEGVVPFFGEGAFHLPAPVVVPEVARVPWEERSGIGFHAPATLKKNALAQLLAVRIVQGRFGERSRLYSNLDKYAPVMEGLGLDHEVEPWLESVREHRVRLASRRVVMCASVAESFCYGAVDAMAGGVPVVGSRTIEWLPEEWQVRCTNDARSIAYRVGRLLVEPPEPEPRGYLERVAARQNERAREAVREYVLRA